MTAEEKSTETLPSEKNRITAVRKEFVRRAIANKELPEERAVKVRVVNKKHFVFLSFI